MNGLSVIFAPLVPTEALFGLGAAALFVLVLSIWRGQRGWPLRGLAALALLAALAQPALQREETEPLSDIVILLEDRTASQALADRGAQSDAAINALERQLAALPNLEFRKVTLPDGAENAGTEIGAALSEALAAEPRARVAGVLAVSDGQAHDAALMPDLPAPLQLMLTGHARDWDRRLVIQTAPAFGIIGEETAIRLRIEDLGAVPASVGGAARISIAIDGEAPASYNVQVGQDLELPLTLTHGGQNVVQFALAPVDGELTTRNNDAVVQINGVRDRLRVLLVSGEPHAGERTWRNLLKSDAAVDLVHFTILRPPEKQDGTPVSELSLIAFPTQELFIEKIDEFDLLIFDRYGARGILPAAYFANIRSYIERGGAVLISAGPEFATVESLYQTALEEIMPARPTGRVLSERFLPRPTALGLRHPVTAGLEGAPPAAGQGIPEGSDHWGRWLRQIELVNPTGEVVMEGAGGSPLLVLSRAGAGRVALLASDHAWLWDRGFEGGGPQLELLRRIAHWAMKEPELEEEALYASVEPGSLRLTITRRTMAETVAPITITGPDGETSEIPLTEDEPGRFTARWSAPVPGLYRFTDGELERVAALGPAAPREFEDTIASPVPLADALAASNGGVTRLEEGVPQIRFVREGRQSAGKGWIGLTRRGAEATVDLRVMPLLPPWAWLVLVALFTLGAWMIEGRQRRQEGGFSNSA